MLGIPLLTSCERDLISVTTLYRVAGWEFCPLSAADVLIAATYRLTIKDL
ncbi:hypothetical protein GCM10010447_55550 [Streptomyces fulvorobeus]